MALNIPRARGHSVCPDGLFSYEQTRHRSDGSGRPAVAAATRAVKPQIDHHQHLFSPETAALATGFNALDAVDLVRLLDKASIRQSLVLSVAYQFGNSNRPPVEDEYAKVKAENDWTSGVSRMIR
jgi:hypothetical protein